MTGPESPSTGLGKQNHITPCGMLFAAIHSVLPCISQVYTIFNFQNKHLDFCQAIGQHHWFVAWFDLCAVDDLCSFMQYVVSCFVCYICMLHFVKYSVLQLLLCRGSSASKALPADAGVPGNPAAHPYSNDRVSCVILWTAAETHPADCAQQKLWPP